MKKFGWTRRVIVNLVKRLNLWLFKNGKAVGIDGVIVIGLHDGCLTFFEFMKIIEDELEKINRVRRDELKVYADDLTINEWYSRQTRNDSIEETTNG